MLHDFTKVDVTTPSDREILIQRSLNAPRELIFDCLTVPALVQRWLLGPPGWTMPVCEIDFRVGGQFRYVWRNTEGVDMGLGGTYREINRPGRIVHNEAFDQDWTGGETTVTSTLTEENGRTSLALNVLYSSAEARDGALRSGMIDGITAAYKTLDALLPTLPAEVVR